MNCAGRGLLESLFTQISSSPCHIEVVSVSRRWTLPLTRHTDQHKGHNHGILERDDNDSLEDELSVGLFAAR
jgi:hypothetical protein